MKQGEDELALEFLKRRNAMTIQGIEKVIDLVQVASVTTVQMVVEEVVKVSAAWIDSGNHNAYPKIVF
uniref:Uncharacterized protein n=1 Tax=Romanomermis culicivorax TaxID=13658 RepID=A0A915I481_ROMCU